MYKNARIIQTRLPVQIVALLIFLAAFTAAAIGLPSVRLMQRQMDRQAWGSLEQGSRMAAAALSDEFRRMDSFARLTAERPTLRRLLESDQPSEMNAYLETLRVSADLDLLMICGGAGDDLAVMEPGTGKAAAFACIEPAPGQLYRIEALQPEGWLLAAHRVEGADAGQRVVIGRAIGPGFIERLRIQDEIEIGLAAGGEWIAGTRPLEADFWTQVRAQLPDAGVSSAGEVEIENGSYYARRTAHTGEAEIFTALSAADIGAARSELIRSLALIILAAAAAALILAFFLARRLIRPLERLRASAVSLSMGNLSTPVTARSRVREINQVAYALEDARSALNHSLQALRREKEWSELLLSSVVEGIVAVDRQGRITFFSQGAERITDRRSAQVLGKHIDEVFKVAGGSQPFSQSLPAPGGRQNVLTIERSRQPVTLAITAASISPPEAGRLGSALVLRDVSDEEALRRLLGDFLANITHEFRTPLSALAASIELMLDQLDTLNPAELRELLDSLRLGTLGLQTLIDNLLEGASIEAGRFRVHPRPTEIQAVVTETAHTVQPLFDKYRQRLQLNLPLDLRPVQIDPRRTSQVLINLLSNAIKWNPENSVVELEVRGEPEAVSIRVADHGPGIPADHLNDVFTRFAHLNIPVGRTEYGAGLGLSVVKAIVEAQGGRVGVENRPEGGARFWFTVPYASLEPEAEGGDAAEPSPAGSRERK